MAAALWYEGSVAIRDGKTAEIARLGRISVEGTINAMILVLAPGFIHRRGHPHFTLPVDGKVKIKRGVATCLGESRREPSSTGGRE